MNQQPDKLFRDKLYHYEGRLSPDAWKRIRQSRDKRVRLITWFKVAATVSLLAVAAFLLLPSTPLEQTATRAEKQNAPASVNRPAVDKPATETTERSGEDPATPSTQQSQAAPGGVIEKPALASRDRQSDERKIPTEIPSHESETPDALVGLSPAQETSVAELEKTPAESTTPAVEMTPKENAALTSVAESDIRPRVTIVLSADMVDEKYLIKKDIPEATTTGKEASTFRKVLDIAYDLKHNQDPIGDLRQMKNEILAFNFNRGKERNDH